MKIAFLCKRRYMDKDVVADRYGRLYEIPYQLSRLGHTVEAFCLDYQKGGAEQVLHQASPGSLRWHSRGLGPGILPGALRYPWHLLRTLRGFAPDMVVGASDIPHVVLGHWLARRWGGRMWPIFTTISRVSARRASQAWCPLCGARCAVPM